VQRVGIGPYGTVLHQSIFCERPNALRLLAASPRLLKLTDEIAMRQALAHGQPKQPPAPPKKAAKKYKIVR
jgi:hypothetical protein